jgi:hypothetical protein
MIDPVTDPPRTLLSVLCIDEPPLQLWEEELRAGATPSV